MCQPRISTVQLRLNIKTLSACDYEWNLENWNDWKTLNDIKRFRPHKYSECENPFDSGF
jgi:hypothetical protein